MRLSSTALPASLPLLFTYRRCPYAMRARMALLHAGRAFQAIEVVLRDKPAELLQLSPKGTVPVLRLADGQVLEQSLDIMRWAWSEGDPDGAWRRSQTPENRALLDANDGPFKHHLDRCKYPERFAAEGVDARAARASAVACLLAPLETRLATATFLGGATPCAADLAVFPFVRQFAAVDAAWFQAQPLPRVQAWLAGWLASEIFAASMVRLPQQPAPVPVLYPAFTAARGEPR